ncbi:uncharacterized protein GGS22DRAFT_151187 [Annulohypoxylon maeteangense]|uniref:uncharacterized protein n=1 Tax=Annulohypoxylon maeteangense TaxID=1927788 RepID=UPI002008D774|nr:uncharacterized protein GGS22DRAFT_151187 [Annulohypoxylon maeteangense]KAI0890541.1 hypothetical protein GGS22DRAFT_151187 [Annulohypoxylon maeteangense]
MAIYPAGKSTRIDSPRHLTLRHSRRLIAAHQRQTKRLLRSSAEDSSGDEDEVDPLPPGQEKLNAYWVPGLEAGQQHRINVSQTINANNGESPLTLTAEQDFFVDAPQFTLPDGSVHSTYPPPGYSDDHRILPHVVLTDPHLPWERLGSPSEGTNTQLKSRIRTMTANGEANPVRNRVPWLVIFSFSQDELRLPPEDLDANTGIFRDTSAGVIKPIKQSSTMTINMSVDDLWKLDNVAYPVTRELVPSGMESSRGDFIFVKPDLFKSLFSTFDADNKQVTGNKPNTSQYQYLAHVRTINSSGMALAGVEDTAVFSIVVGNRAGPLDNASPTTMCVHLVSIEGVEGMNFPTSDQRYVALCSLHSWNYTVLPPGLLNVPDAFEHLGSTLDVLRTRESIIAPLRTSSSDAEKRVARRLNDGYTMTKYYTQTGETTVALYRGPFTPTYVPPLENLSRCSNSGVDLQILDKDLGIMDITYSVAWQTGRTMALADESFTAALCRLRSFIHKEGSDEAKMQTLKEFNDSGIRTREEVLRNLSNTVDSLAALHINSDPMTQPEAQQPAFTAGGAKKRWFRQRLTHSQIPDLGLNSRAIKEKYPAAARKAVKKVAQSTSGGLYDETNDPLSTDWMIVLAWLVDRMFLKGVPAHLLVADPTHLEPESLRFFRIDSNWIDALIDGALSLGNHFGVDVERSKIKDGLNEYIQHKPVGHEHSVQIPTYGFYLRSDLVTMFPDLRVEVLADEAALISAGEDPPTGAPLLLHEIVTDGVMMAYMDRIPGSPQFSSLVFTQPAHQQRFAAARGLDSTQIKVDIRRQYTVDQTTRETDGNRQDALIEFLYHPPSNTTSATDNEPSPMAGGVPSEDKGSSDNIFIWDSEPGSGLNDLRILRLPQFANVQLQTLQERMGSYGEGDDSKPYFNENASTSALLAMQLNDPIYKLEIDLKGHPNASSMASLGPPGDVGIRSPEIRTLKQLGTSYVKRLTVNDGRSNDIHEASDEASDSDDEGESTFERHSGYEPSSVALSTNLAPHIRALPIVTKALTATGIRDDTVPVSETQGSSKKPNVPDSGDPASAPQYDITISSNSIGNWSIIQLTEHNLNQDIIFSILLSKNTTNQYMLVELDISIPLGPAKASPSDPRNFLMPTYVGPGAHMLTNLRFNVLPSITGNDQPVLQLRVLPRAAKGWIDASTVKELSFLLGLAPINQPQGAFTQVDVQSWAVYCKDAENPRPGVGNTITIKNPPTRVTVYGF